MLKPPPRQRQTGPIVPLNGPGRRGTATYETAIESAVPVPHLPQPRPPPPPAAGSLPAACSSLRTQGESWQGGGQHRPEGGYRPLGTAASTATAMTATADTTTTDTITHTRHNLVPVYTQRAPSRAGAAVFSSGCHRGGAPSGCRDAPADGGRLRNGPRRQPPRCHQRALIRLLPTLCPAPSSLPAAVLGGAAAATRRSQPWPPWWLRWPDRRSVRRSANPSVPPGRRG